MTESIAVATAQEFAGLLGAYGDRCEDIDEEAGVVVYDLASAAGDAVTAAYDAAVAEVERLRLVAAEMRREADAQFAIWRAETDEARAKTYGGEWTKTYGWRFRDGSPGSMDGLPVRPESPTGRLVATEQDHWHGPVRDCPVEAVGDDGSGT